MIVDSSALVAIILNEPEEEAMLTAILRAPAARISAANWLEAAVVADRRRRPTAPDRFGVLMDMIELEVVPMTADHAAHARDAYSRFGRGKHPARLNFGDCIAYALAKSTGEPLLFKGQDFPQTDVTPALM